MEAYAPGSGGASTSCFTVYAGGKAFALPATDAECIFRIGMITPVPLAPGEVVGLTNLRGRVMTIVSLELRTTGNCRAIEPGAIAIGMRFNGEDFALVVDRVGDVVSITPEQRVQMLPLHSQERGKVTEGLYRIGDDLLPMLDARALVSRPDGAPGSGP